MDKPQTSFKNLLWSPKTEHHAKLARMAALVLSIYCSVIWTIYAVVSLFSPSIYGNWAIFYAILFIVISYALYKMRREAAITGVIISCVGLIFLDWASSNTFETLKLIAMLLSYLVAVRGTYAYVYFQNN